MGKGSRRRPRSITSAEEDLNWDLYEQRITKQTYLRRFAKLKRQGLIQRDGRVIK